MTERIHINAIPIDDITDLEGSMLQTITYRLNGIVNDTHLDLFKKDIHDVFKAHMKSPATNTKLKFTEFKWDRRQGDRREKVEDIEGGKRVRNRRLRGLGDER